MGFCYEDGESGSEPDIDEADELLLTLIEGRWVSAKEGQLVSFGMW